MSKKLLKNLLWLLVLLMLAVWVAISTWTTRQNRPYRAGVTCNSYYKRHDLLTCPKKYEFDDELQKCVAIGENGCTAFAVPTTIDETQFSCGPRRTYRRDRNRPCQALINCTDNMQMYSAEGMCFKFDHNHDTFAVMPCMQVPGCRHLDMVHVPQTSYIGNVNAVPSDKFTCSMLDDDNVPFLRTAEQPCFVALACHDNSATVMSCPYHWQCLDEEHSCVPCWYYDRCRYRNAYSAVYGIALT